MSPDLRPTGTADVDVDVLIVGAGPHALTVAAYLRDADPGLRLLVADPDGWLHRWRGQFAALRLPHLRSACVHHPDPDPYALLRHARDTGRGGELHGPHQCPGTALFADFCGALVTRLGLDEVLVRSRVRALEPVPGGLRVELAPAPVLARHVVVATNPVRPRWPDRLPPGPASDPTPVAHSDTLDLRIPPARGERVVVLGGGLTAAQLALAAARAGARTTLVSRRPLCSRAFDTGPEWLGRALPGFHAEADPRRRLAMIHSARDGGTVPPAVLRRLRASAGRNRIELVTGPPVLRDGGRHAVEVGAAGRTWTADRLWLGTGHDLDWRAEPLLAALDRCRPVDAAGGLPVLGPDLSWPGTSVHLLGGLAALAVGPTARNITGARMAAERIRQAIVGGDHPRQYPAPDLSGPTREVC